MPKIVTIEQMRAIEQASDAAGHSYAAMMDRAGRAVAERVKQIVRGLPDPQVVILVGPGNNGGDGLVAGRVLIEDAARLGQPVRVSAFLLKERGDDDPVFAAARAAGVCPITNAEDKPTGYATLRDWLSGADVVVDALFGTSLRLPVRGDASKVMQIVRAATAESQIPPEAPFVTPAAPPEIAPEFGPVVVAVDCPSGLDCDTGQADQYAIPACETITFAAAKPGLFVFPGAELVGTLHIAGIGLPDGLAELDTIPLELVDAAAVAARLPERPRDSHKGTFGKAMVVAGSLNYIGAPVLAGHAAYRVGTGLVTVGAPQVIVPTLAGMLMEATWVLLPHNMGVLNEAAVRVLRKEIAEYDALLVGPGLGREDVTGEFMRELLRPQEEVKHSRAIGFVPAQPDDVESTGARADLPPLVIDADGLNLLAGMDDWAALVPPHTILTPHPGEFARLAGLDTGAVNADRLNLAQAKAAEWGCIVVLKGAFTVIAAPDGRTALLPFATSALASAGTGDVLAGSIVGLLAQGLDPFDAAVAGGWLHGLAGARAELLSGSAASVTAGDVLDLLPEAVALAGLA
ncbi:MAG: NAD(P)H-hydrate dehydratase [Anaerolineae bacterium]|nr:NAD(P)H-hydrate dehydratase [Anaerolineae bacterium]